MQDQYDYYDPSFLPTDSSWQLQSSPSSQSAPDPFAQWGGQGSTQHRQAIANAYTNYLGRPIQDNEYQYWTGNANFENEIANSPEALARRGGGGAGGGGGAAGGYGAVPAPTNYSTPSNFADPNAHRLEQLANDRINYLQQDPARPNLDAWMNMLKQQQDISRQRAGEFATFLRGREADLRKDPYTDQQSQVMLTKATEGLERRRQQTLNNRRNEIYARGFAPTSGLVSDVENSVNTSYDQQRGGIESDLLQSAIAEAKRRQDQADQLESLAVQALNGGDVSALQNAAQMSDLENSLISDKNNRQLQALTAAGIPIDLANSQTQLALQILGAGGGPASLLPTLISLGGLNNQNRQIDSQNRASNLGGLGQLASIISGLFRS